MKNKKHNPIGDSGYAVLELLFYISLFAIVSLVTINAMVVMTKSFRETTIQGELVQGATIMEKITREIRGANDISTIGGGNIILNTEDEAGTAKTVQFHLSGDDIELLENGTLVGNLNSPNLQITALDFTQITTTEGKAVKVTLTIRSSNDALGRTEDFYDTIVLRGNY